MQCKHSKHPQNEYLDSMPTVALGLHCGPRGSLRQPIWSTPKLYGMQDSSLC